MPIIACEKCGFFLVALHLVSFLYFLFSRTVSFILFFAVVCVCARIRSLSQYLADCCCCCCRRCRRHLHRYCSTRYKLRQENYSYNNNNAHQRDAQVCREHTQPRSEDVRSVCIHMCCCRVYVQVSSHKIVPHITHKIYIQYTLCSLTCTCLWRFYSPSTLVFFVAVCVVQHVRSFFTKIQFSLFLYLVFFARTPYSHLSNTNFLLNGFISCARDWNSIKKCQHYHI